VLYIYIRAIRDVLNIRQKKVFDKELDLIARQDDQKTKHKSLIKYIKLDKIQEQHPRRELEPKRCVVKTKDGFNLNFYIY
jgi:hypothetical protein